MDGPSDDSLTDVTGKRTFDEMGRATYAPTMPVVGNRTATAIVMSAGPMP